MSSSTGFVTIGAESIEVVACCKVVRGWLDDATATNRGRDHNTVLTSELPQELILRHKCVIPSTLRLLQLFQLNVEVFLDTHLLLRPLHHRYYWSPLCHSHRGDVWLLRWNLVLVVAVNCDGILKKTANLVLHWLEGCVDWLGLWHD
jgi:hypothetical protein